MTTIRTSNSGFIFVDPASPLENIGWTATLLADSDFATIVAQVERYQELNYTKEYNDVGGGSIKLDLDDPIFQQPLPSGQTVPIREQQGLWQIYHNGILRGEFLAEDVKEVTLEKDSNPRGVEVAGRGTGLVLEWGLVLPLGMPAPTTLTRTFSGAGMAFWLQLLNECKARGGLTFVNPQFSATLDSAGNAWTDFQSISINAGENLLDLLQKWAESLGKRWFMAPGFKLYVYPEEGNHRETTVALSIHNDQVDAARSSTRREIANYVAAQSGDKSVAVATSSTSMSRWHRREQWVSTGQADDISSAQIVANAIAKINSDQKTARTFSVIYDVPGALIFQDYDVGDWVGVEIQDFVTNVGIFDPKHVTAIAVKINNDNDVDAEVTFEGKFEVRARRLQRIIDKLGGSSVGGGSSAQGSVPLGVSTYDLAQTRLSQLADVQLTTLLPNQVLTWNGTRWTNANGAVSPSAPLSLSASASVLTWTVPLTSGSTAIVDYLIQYRTTAGPGSWTTWSHTVSTATTATVTGLSPGTSYDFQVAAINSVGTSPFSNIATGVTLSPPVRRGISSGAKTSGTTVPITYPAGLQVGDLMVLYYSDAWPNSSMPSGWATFQTPTNAANINGAIAWKIATSADVATPTSSYVVTNSNVGNWIIVAYQAGTFSPGVLGTQNQDGGGPTTFTIVSPAVASGGVLLTFDGALSNSPVLSANQGSLIRTQADGTTKAYAYELQTSAAVQAYSVVWTSTTGVSQYGGAIAIQNSALPMVSDNFNRADTSPGTLGTTSDGLRTWIMTGGFSIASNQATSNALAFAVVNQGPPDAIVTVTLAALVSGEFIGVVGRYNDSNNHYLAQYQQSSGFLQLYKRVGGTYTQLGSNFSVAWAAGDTIGLYMKGTTIKAQWNGVDRITVTDSTAFTNTFCGLYTSGSGTTKRYDNFIVTAP
jgi:hypothetical protein